MDKYPYIGESKEGSAPEVEYMDVKWRAVGYVEKEWPAVGDEVSFPSGKGVLVVDKPDINGVIIVKSTDSDSIDEYKKVSFDAIKKPPTPEDKLESELRVFIDVNAWGFCRYLAKAIISGEIEGLEYKPQ